MSLTPEQKAFRRTGIFASDVAMLTGHSSFGGPFDVFNDKVGGHDREPSFPMELGDLLEPVCLELYRRRMGGAPVFTFPGSMKHPEIDHLGATPDAVVKETIIQCKTCNPWARDEFGAAWTDEIPPGYLIQVQFEMLVLGKRVADVPVLFGTQSFEIYRVHYDAELAANLVTIATDFWTKHVIPKVPPPIDATPACGSYLADRFPQGDGEIKGATPEVAAAVSEFRKHKAAKKAAEALQIGSANRIRDFIADADGVEGPDWRATWRYSAKQKRRNLLVKFKGEEETDNG